MAYEKTTWVSGQTPLSATNLNHIENGIEKNSNDIAQLSNPNLLINSDFRNPVNQEGQTTYAGSSSMKYTIDGWCMQAKTSSFNVQVHDGFVHLQNNSGSYDVEWLQYLEHPLIRGEKYTLSIKSDNGFHFVTFTAGTASNVLTFKDGCTLKYLPADETCGYDRVIVCVAKHTSTSLYYINLNPGPFATALHETPFAERLALCQRYYQTIENIPLTKTTQNSKSVFLTGFIFPVRMRTTPTYSGIVRFQGMNVTDYAFNFNEEGMKYASTNTLSYDSMDMCENKFDARIYG